MTYNFGKCLAGEAKDSDHSGSISMQELTDCVQARLDKTQEATALQHATLVGNTALVPVFAATDDSAKPPTDTPSAPADKPNPADTLATLHDIFQQRDDRWEVQVTLAQPTLKIGGNLNMSIRSQRNGFVYVFYRGTQADSFYLLFPNQLDASDTISANQELALPRQDWSVTGLGPRGTDHLLIMVSETPRDFSALALPAEYVSQSGPFDKITPTTRAAQRISEIATL